MSAGLRVERRAAGLWLVLDRPERRNPLSLDVVSGLREALRSVAEDVRAVVLAGAPPAFCCGADTDELAELVTRGGEAVRETVYGHFQGLVRDVRTCPVPVVAALDGMAFGGGFDLAMAADLRLASPRAMLRTGWVERGLVPALGGAAALLRAVGGSHAGDLLLTGRAVGAQEALALGIVSRVADDVAALAEQVVAEIAALPPAAVVAGKAALRRIRDAGLEEELTRLAEVQAGLLAPGQADSSS